MPSIAPLPKRCGWAASFFSSEYDANDARMAPPPGSTPSAEPSAVPRSIGLTIWRKSSREGMRPPTALTSALRERPISRLRQISQMPNRPIAMATNSRPSASSGRPKVKRSVPLSRSWPTVHSNTPSTSMASAFITEPCASVMEAIRPSTMSAKYSGEPTLSANSVSGGASTATSSVAQVPAKNEPMAAVASAVPARPWRAIWWPSSAVTIDDASPGMLIRMAVVDPPYCVP